MEAWKFRKADGMFQEVKAGHLRETTGTLKIYNIKNMFKDSEFQTYIGINNWDLEKAGIDPNTNVFRYDEYVQSFLALESLDSYDDLSHFFKGWYDIQPS